MFSFQVYPGNVLNTYHWRPQGVDRVTVWRGWYTPDGEESEVINRLAQQDRETTVEEDIRIVESVQRGLGSRGYRPGPLVLDPKGGVNSEHSVYYLQKWMREAVEGLAAADNQRGSQGDDAGGGNAEGFFFLPAGSSPLLRR